MNSKVNLLFLPYHNTGGHFIDWSIKFVSGQSTVIDASEGSKNWHQHRTIYAFGYQDLMQKYETVMQNAFDYNSIYVGTMPLPIALKNHCDTTLDFVTKDQIKKAKDYIRHDTKLMLQWAQMQKIPLIIFDYCRQDIYSVFYNNRSYVGLHGENMKNQQEVVDQWVKSFFYKSYEKFPAVDTWDRREMLALTLNFQEDIVEILNLYNARLPHLYYTTDDIWNTFDTIIEEICNELNLPIDAEKFAAWQLIYNNWRKVHDPYFGRHLDRIVQAIVDGHYMSLKRFKMTFFHEIIIQNQLITNHNLNLKTWQLEKFPDNTLDIHALLEPNIHPIN